MASPQVLKIFLTLSTILLLSGCGPTDDNKEEQNPYSVGPTWSPENQLNETQHRIYPSHQSFF